MVSELVESLEIPNHNQLTVVKGDMKITGYPLAIAQLLTTMEKEKERKPFPMVVSDLPRFPTIYDEGYKVSDSRKTRIGILPKLPNPKEVSIAYIEKFATYYNREQAIEFIKGYVHRKILPRKYR